MSVSSPIIWTPTSLPGKAPTPAIRIATSILAGINTWAFKREQPARPETILSGWAREIARDAPVSLLLYWGKGPRISAGRPEQACLAYLNRLLERVAATYPNGGRLILIYTDTHAELNGHTTWAIENYLQSMRAIGEQQPITWYRLSAICSAYGDGLPQSESLDPDLLARLERSSARWYRGEGGVGEGAARYLAMNLQEKKAVERAFPDAAFLTFNSSELDCLFPDKLGIFYMYSIKKGVADKPWFLPDEG